VIPCTILPRNYGTLYLTIILKLFKLLIVKLIYHKPSYMYIWFLLFYYSNCVSSLIIVRLDLCFRSFCVSSLIIVTFDMCYSILTTSRSNVWSFTLMFFESWFSPYAFHISMNDLKVTLFGRFDMLREWKWIFKKLFVYMHKTLWTCYWFGENATTTKLGGI